MRIKIGTEITIERQSYQLTRTKRLLSYNLGACFTYHWMISLPDTSKPRFGSYTWASTPRQALFAMQKRSLAVGSAAVDPVSSSSGSGGREVYDAKERRRCGLREEKAEEEGGERDAVE